MADTNSDGSRTSGDEPLTIVGASTRAAAWSARRACFFPFTADLFADLDLAEIASARQVEKYPHDLEAVLREPHAGGWMYCGALENYPELIEACSRMRPLFGNDARTLRAVRDPWQVAACLARAGIPYPALTRSDEALSRDGSWLRKPLRSAGGQQIVRMHEATAAADRPSYFQKHVPGSPFSASFVAVRGRSRLLGITRQLLMPDSFRYCGSIGPMTLSANQHEQFERVGAALASEFALTGLFGVDAILAEGTVWPVEVNPRYTASMEVLETALDFSAVGWHLSACRDGQLPADVPVQASRIVGKQIVFAERDLVVRGDLREQIPKIADVPRPGTAIPSGMPILTILRERESDDQVAMALLDAVATVQNIVSTY